MFCLNSGTVTAQWVKRFVSSYRSKRRSTLEARRVTEQQATAVPNSMATEASTTKNGGNIEEEIGMTARMKPNFDFKGSPKNDIKFDEQNKTSHSGSNEDKGTPHEIYNGEIHENMKDTIFNDVNDKYTLHANTLAKPRIPVISIDSDTDDKSDIEEIIGEIIRDDTDIYDSAEIAIHAAWDESESEDNIDVNEVDELTHQRRYRRNVLQKEVHFPATTEVIVESRGKSRYRRSFSEPVLETTLKEKPSSSQRKDVKKHKRTKYKESFDPSPNRIGNAVSKDIPRTSSDNPLEDVQDVHDDTKDSKMADSDIISNRTQSFAEATNDEKDKSQQKHTSHESTQEITSNGGVKSSEKRRVSHPRQDLFQEASPSPGNIDKEVNDISFPWWMAFLLLFVYLIIGMFMFHFAIKWNYLDSFYYSFVSLSTIGFGDLYYQPSAFPGSIYYTFIYCFVGFCYTSMCMSLSSRELLRIARRVAWKIGYYRSRRWKRDFRLFWKARRLRAPRRAGRWSDRRRKPLRVQRIVSESPGAFP